MHQTGKEQEGTGEDILSRGSGPAHTPPKSFLHGKLVKYPPHRLPHIFRLSFSTGRVGLRKPKATSHKTNSGRALKLCAHTEQNTKDAARSGGTMAVPPSLC